MTDPDETQSPKFDFFAALARILDDVRSKATRTRAAIGSWVVEHEEGISLFFIVAQVLGDVLPSVGELADDWQDGPWRHLLTNLELSDALGLLVELAGDTNAVEELLEAVLASPAVTKELVAEVERAPLNDALRQQLRHGLDLAAEHEYVLAVPALIQALEGAFWHLAEERELICRDGDKMRRVTLDGSVGKPIGGVEAVLSLLDLDVAYRTFLCELVFGGRGNRFRHGNALDGWRLEALLLLVALTTWLERFGAPQGENYLRRAFASSGSALEAAVNAFPALGALAEMKPEAVEPTITTLMIVAGVLRTTPTATAVEGSSVDLMPDPKRDVAHIRDTQHWPMSPWLPIIRSDADGEREAGLVYDEDIDSDDVIRVFDSTPQSEQALMARSVIDGRQLPLLYEYGSLERLLADGWSVD